MHINQWNGPLHSPQRLQHEVSTTTLVRVCPHTSNSESGRESPSPWQLVPNSPPWTSGWSLLSWQYKTSTGSSHVQTFDYDPILTWSLICRRRSLQFHYASSQCKHIKCPKTEEGEEEMARPSPPQEDGKPHYFDCDPSCQEAKYFYYSKGELLVTGQDYGEGYIWMKTVLSTPTFVYIFMYIYNIALPPKYHRYQLFTLPTCNCVCIISKAAIMKLLYVPVSCK